MKETTKATLRRNAEKFDWKSVFSGTGIDIGPGDDPHRLASVTFDKHDGDANFISLKFKKVQFDWVHASQVLEHMVNPKAAILDWFKIVKAGGYIVITVPSWELYEGMIWPSRFNPDHKSTWSLWQKGSPAPHHVYVPDFVSWIISLGHSVIRSKLIDTNYSYKVGTSKDQTLSTAEAFIEIVIRKGGKIENRRLTVEPRSTQCSPAP